MEQYEDAIQDIGANNEGRNLGKNNLDANEENCLKYNWKWKDGYCSVND